MPGSCHRELHSMLSRKLEHFGKDQQGQSAIDDISDKQL